MRTIRTVLTILTFLLILILASVGIILIFGNLNTKDQAKILIEVGKSLLQLSLIVILGGVVSELLKSFDRRRQQDKALHGFREELLKALRLTYQNVKRSRRALRVIGLTTKYGTVPITMSVGQKDAYKKEMELLNEQQLRCEALLVEIGNFPEAFSSGILLQQNLQKMTGYLRNIQDEYEAQWTRLDKDISNTKFESFSRLSDFTGKYQDSNFKDEFADTYDKAIGLLRQDLLLYRVAKGDGETVQGSKTNSAFYENSKLL